MQVTSGLIIAGLALMVSPTGPSALAAWRQLLPASGGAVNQITTDPNGVLYTFTNAGLFKSADLGQTWSSITGNLALPAGATLATDPVTAGIVYLGTDHGSLFRSVDGGFSWSQLSLSTSAPIQLIAVAPTNPNFIFVATWGDYLYRSLDGGLTWSRQTQGISNAPNAPFITSIAVDPTNANRVYTSTWRGRLFRSDDAAGTFSQISDDGLWANGQMYIAASSPNVLYMTYDEFSFGRGTILKSVDFGNTWSNAGRPSGRPTDAAQIAIHPADPNTVYVSTGLGISKTTNGGGNWALILTPASLPLRGMQAMALNPAHPSQVFAGSYYFGFYRSLDSGATWFPFNNGIPGATITGIEISRDSPSVMYAGVQTVGYTKSSDAGATWNVIGTTEGLQKLSLGALGVHPQNPNIVLAVTQSGVDVSTENIWRSLDGGVTFTAVSSGYFPGWLRFNPLSPNFVSASIADYQGGLLLSPDAGASWAVPEFHYIYPGDYVYHPTLSNIVLTVGNQYTGAPLDSLYLLWSNNNGSSWNQSSLFGEGNMNALALDKKNPTVLYVAGRIAGEGTQGVYKYSISYSGPNVTSVTRIPGTFNSGLTNTSIRRLYYEPINGYLYASTPTGIFRSNDQALTWTSISTGLPYLSTDAITSTPDGNRLLVGTGGGIWEYTDRPPSTPVVSLAPTALSFGSLPQGIPAKLSVLLSNTGDGQLFIARVESHSSEFVVANHCPSIINPGANCTVDVTFTPAAIGLRGATLIFSDNALDSPQTVPLSGTGLPPGMPAVSLSPSSLVFPNQPLGTTSDVQTVTIANVGAAPLVISRGNTTGDFHTSANTCGTSVAPGSACSIQVYFSPTASGTSIGQLVITDNTTDSPQNIQLSGPSMLDTDGDGIPDDWERFGVTINGIFLNLPAMGANWLKKDIFVKVDWMQADDHNHQPKPDSMTKLIAAFANAPVSNPDGSTGITLHADCGPTCIMDPIQGTTWGAMSQARALLHLDPITGSTNQLGSKNLLGRYDWTSFDAIKNVNFSPVLAAVFHYVVFAHDLFGFPGSSGLARATPASDAIVSLGSYTGAVGTVVEQAGTLMHELGHNLGLTHGGVDPAKGIYDGINYKPNFLSVMNYLFQTRGLMIGGLEGNLDYSRFVLPTLDENTLDERVGLNSPLAANYGTRYFCPNATVDTPVVGATAPIDWNCNGIIESSVQAYITEDTSALISLASYNDWSNLKFTGGSIGQPGAPPPPKQTPVQELTQQQDAKITTVHGVAVVSPANTVLPSGGSTNLVFTLTNKGNVSDVFSINATATQSWVDLSTVLPQIPLTAGATTVITIPIQAPSSVTPAEAIADIVVRATSLANPLVLDSARTTLRVGAADLAVAMTHNPDPVVLGNNLIYTVVVTNNGPDAATTVVLTDMLSPNVTLVSATTASGICVGAGTLQCALGALAAGENTSIAITVTPGASGTISNTVTATSSVYDPIPADNTATDSTVVVGKPSLAARISGQSKTGTIMSLSVTLTNVGTGTANNVSVNQVLLRTLAGSGTVTYAGPALPVPLGTLSQGESRVVTFTLNMPSTVAQFSVSERGTTQDSIGNMYSFGAAQSVMP